MLRSAVVRRHPRRGRRLSSSNQTQRSDRAIQREHGWRVLLGHTARDSLCGAQELFVFITVLLNHCPRPSGTPGKQVLTAQEVVKRRKREVNDDANAGDSDRQ